MNTIQKIKDYFTPELKNEISMVVKDFSYIAFPQILFYCCMFLQMSINLLFISLKYRNATLMNAVGISHIYVNVTTAVVFSGIAGALDTLASNAYGKKNFRLIGAYFDRCRFISIAFFMLILAFHTIFSKTLLGYLKVDDSVMGMVIRYVQIYVFAQLFQVNFQMYAKLFVLIEKSYYNLYLSVGAMGVHTICCSFFIFVCNFGIIGGAMSFLITAIFESTVATVIAHHLDLPSETFKYFTKEGLQEWSEYFKYAIPNIFLGLGEWVGYEIQGIMAIYISPEAYTVNIIVINFENLTFPYTIGLSVAIAMKTGERLMTASSNDLKRFVTIVYGFSLCLSVIVLTIVYIFSSPFFSLMAPEENIYKKCCEIIPFLMAYILFTNGFYFFMHVLKGFGYLRNPTIATFVNFYLIQISLTYIFCFVFNCEVNGIYTSMSIGSLLTFMLFAYWTYSKDIDVLKQNAEDRISNDEKKILKIEMKPIQSDEENNVTNEISNNTHIRLIEN